jgi:hypothetical protein
MSRSAVLAALFVIGLVSLGEIRLRERLLYSNGDQFEFVRANVAGILEGKVVSKSWQHRVLAPAVVSVLTVITGSHASALRLLSNLLTAAANLLLFALVRRRGGRAADAVRAVAVFGFCHLLLMYKLEYPWDGVDILLFMTFGAWASAGRPLSGFWPLLALGALNHETVLYVPLWYFIAAFAVDAPSPPAATARRIGVEAGLAALALGAIILALRQLLYVGRPDFPPAWFESSAPIAGNHFHLVHNLRQLLVDDWRLGRSFISAGLLAAIGLFVALARRRRHATAALWSLVVIGTIFCFGYVNETRHYLLLVAFWSTYLAPGPYARNGRGESHPVGS